MTRIPYFAQERPESCVPACLRMVLAAYGIQQSETDLYLCCETDADGTLPRVAARCAQRLGLVASSERLSTIQQLQEVLVLRAAIAIAFVNLTALLGVPVIHAVVIESVDPLSEQTITILDPAYPPTGRRLWSMAQFEMGWGLARHQVILIGRG